MTGLNPLTIRQYNILVLLRDGHKQKELPYILHWSLATLNLDVRYILLKLQANSIAHAIVTTIQQHYLPLNGETPSDVRRPFPPKTSAYHY